jgi:hypothetical protein
LATLKIPADELSEMESDAEDDFMQREKEIEIEAHLEEHECCIEGCDKSGEEGGLVADFTYCADHYELAEERYDEGFSMPFTGSGLF